MKTIKYLIPILFTFACATFSSAQDKVDENALFSDSSSVIDSSKMVNTKEAKGDAEDKKSVGFSGEVNAYGTPSFPREWGNDAGLSTVGFSSEVVGNALIDARLIGGAKAFADLEAFYASAGAINLLQSGNTFGTDTGMQFAARELFVDVNYNKLVYVRAGKQVLQWGRCTLWNPTDFVNIERPTFIARMGHRDGTYGIKMHIPYKTLFNFYSFVDANNAQKISDLALSVKAEALLGRTEFAFSGWKKDGWKPIFGVDLSSQLFNVLIAAEASLRNGIDMPTLDLNTMRVTNMGDNWIPRAAVNLTKMFPFQGVADRLTVSGEFYYNNAGYDVNIFNDPKKLAGLLALAMSSASESPASRLYEVNSYSKYYGMVYSSISQFIIDPLTFSCNALGNFNQNSYVVSIGLNYLSMQNLSWGVSVDSYLGKKGTEYNFTGNGETIRLQTGMTF